MVNTQGDCIIRKVLPFLEGVSQVLIPCEIARS
jgi:hypothetical protein